MSSQLRYADRIEVRQAFFRSPFLDPSPNGGSSAVPGKGCSVAKVAAGPYLKATSNMLRPCLTIASLT